MKRLCQEKTPGLTLNGSSVIGIDLGLAGEHQLLLLKRPQACRDLVVGHLKFSNYPVESCQLQ